MKRVMNQQTLQKIKGVKMKLRYQPCITNSMLTSSDFVSDSERQEIYNFAPSEGNRPLNIFRDQHFKNGLSRDISWTKEEGKEC